MTRVHRLLKAGLLTLGVLAGGLALGGSPALAAGEGLGITATFGSSTSTTPDPEPLSGPSGVAVNQTSGDVYVVDRGNNRVERFSSSGAYEAQFNGTEIDGAPAGAGHEAPAKFSEPSGIAIDPTNGDVYVIDTGHNVIDKFNEAGEYIGQLSLTRSLMGVAVDSSGNLWVYESQGIGYIAEFSETEFSKDEAPENQFSFQRETFPALAVDSADNVYVVFHLGQPLGKYNLIGVQQAASETEAIRPVSALAIDFATDDLYVGLGTSLAQYGPGGEPFSKPLYRSGARSSTLSASGIAVNSTSHAVYVTDSSRNLVDVFALGPFPTEPKTAEAKVAGETVELEGEPQGGESGYYFAFNDNGGCGGGGRTPEGEATGTAKKSAKIARGLLEPGAQYKVCLVATNVYGEASGPPSTPFLAPAVSPFVEEAHSSEVGPYEATLQAKVNPEKQDTKCVLEYGETTKYGTPVACEPADLGEGYGPQPASLHLENLQPSTTYDYRFVATNPTGSSKPTEGTGQFKTPQGLEPKIDAESVSVESGSGATREVTFAAQVNPELQETSSCVFQYVTEKTFEETGFTGTPPSVGCKPSQTFGRNVSGGMGVEAKLAGLLAGVDYRYRVVAADRTGTGYGPVQAFGPPTVLSKAPSIAPSTTATIGGEVDPESLDTRYYVQYGETDAYGQIAPYPLRSAEEELKGVYPVTPGLDAGSGETTVVLGQNGGPPDISLESLTPGATYHYRLVAYNADGTTYGAPMTVKVLPAPQVGPATVSEVTPESATISTSVNPEGLHTLYELEVGTSAAYGTPHPGDAGSGSAPVPLTFHLSGLHAGDTYHFRLKASNSDGSSSEADQTFETAAAVVEAPLELIKPPLELGLVSVTAKAFPTEPKPTTTKALTRAQKLANALKACKRKAKSKRAACVKQARKRYGPVKKAKK